MFYIIYTTKQVGSLFETSLVLMSSQSSTPQMFYGLMLLKNKHERSNSQQIAFSSLRASMPRHYNNTQLDYPSSSQRTITTKYIMNFFDYNHITTWFAQSSPNYLLGIISLTSFDRLRGNGRPFFWGINIKVVPKGLNGQDNISIKGGGEEVFG